jgi:hypothetical protein
VAVGSPAWARKAAHEHPRLPHGDNAGCCFAIGLPRCTDALERGDETAQVETALISSKEAPPELVENLCILEDEASQSRRSARRTKASMCVSRYSKRDISKLEEWRQALFGRWLRSSSLANPCAQDKTVARDHPSNLLKDNQAQVVENLMRGHPTRAREKALSMLREAGS